jgi:hypothetical protein
MVGIIVVVIPVAVVDVAADHRAADAANDRAHRARDYRAADRANRRPAECISLSDARPAQNQQGAARHDQSPHVYLLNVLDVFGRRVASGQATRGQRGRSADGTDCDLAL